LTANSTLITVNTTTSVNQGIQLTVGTQSNTVQIGNFVTDVTQSAYMPAQQIGFVGKGFRPNQRLHAFFDSILIDNYCAPGIQVATDTSTANSISPLGYANTPLIANSTGGIAGIFYVPDSTFKTGDRVLELADVNNLAQGNDAITTSGVATFTASPNITVTKQVTTLTTVNPVIGYVPVTNTVVTTNTTVVTTKIPDVVNIDSQWEPIAQALTISTKNNEAGVFATSLTIYFKQKSQISQNGVQVYLCETTNGYPDGSKILPFSTVHLDYNSINLPSAGHEADVGTTFTFESPVFLQNGTTYAFIVKPDNNDPDYWVYSALLGDTDITTGAGGVQMYSQPVIGTAFYGATTTEWTALQTEYLKFQLNIANFTASSGDAYFNNVDADYFYIYNIATVNTAITVGDYIFQSINSTVSTAQTAVIGRVGGYDNIKNVVYIDSSSGGFVANGFAQIHRFANLSAVTSPGPNTTTLIAYGNTGLPYNPIVDAFVPRIASITPAGTTISMDYKGTSNSYVVDGNTNPLTIGTETQFFDKERILVSKSVEVANMGGAKSSNIHVKMTSDTPYLSPVIDTVRMGGKVIGNLVDKVSNIYNEYYTNGGSKSKYISQIVTLSAGQDAQDLQVSITAHRPPGTDIKVYVRFLNGQDPEPISVKTWTPLLNNGYNVYSDPTNPNDFQQFSYTTYPYYPMASTNGTISSSNSSNVVTGSATQFGNTGDIQVGMWVNMLANSTFSEQSRQVTAITSNTSLQLNLPFNGNYSAQPIFIVAPPTTAWASANTITQLANSSGAFANSLGAVATVSTSTTNNTIIGSNTNFTALLPGQVINIANYSQAIVSIANSTQLTVGAPWPVTVTGANGYIIAQNGLTYLNSNNSLFTTFKQFQIKTILQSNDSSKVPLMNDLTALALQL
jgi:hypothetical protein